MIKLRFAAPAGAAQLLAAIACLAAQPAVASPGDTITTLSFTGTCTDCTGTATGTLDIVNFEEGAAFNFWQFGGFHYDATDLQSAISVGYDDVTAFYGTINLSGASTVTLGFKNGGTDWRFYSDASGAWQIGPFEAPNDYGTGASWSPAAVPEPASWAMMLSGFGVAGYAMRRSRKAKVSFA